MKYINIEFHFALEVSFSIIGISIILFFVLNSAEHEILNAHKYKKIKKFGLF